MTKIKISLLIILCLYVNPVVKANVCKIQIIYSIKLTKIVNSVRAHIKTCVNLAHALSLQPDSYASVRQFLGPHSTASVYTTLESITVIFW